MTTSVSQHSPKANKANRANSSAPFFKRTQNLLGHLSSPKQAFFCILGLIGLTLFFWIGSRYPQLSHKAQSAGHVTLSSLITLNPHFPVHDNDALLSKIWTTALNWFWANRIGMSFGVVFASLSLTLVHLIQRPKTSNGFLNSLFGLILGAPLGICTNCATPVARGLMAGGETLETALAVLISSPSFNAIVVGMTFALFPLQMALLKYGLIVLMVLVILPQLVKRLPDSIRYAQLNPSQAQSCQLPQQIQLSDAGACAIPSQSITPVKTHESWPQALKGFTLSFLKNFWMLIKLTLPLMILAGFMAALGVHTLPLDQWLQVQAEATASPFTSWTSLFGIALFAVLMPMPMAFDVILAQALYSNGLPPSLTMPLLTGLGMISVFPLTVLFTSVSKRLALWLFLASFMLVLLSSVLIQWLGAPPY